MKKRLLAGTLALCLLLSGCGGFRDVYEDIFGGEPASSGEPQKAGIPSSVYFPFSIRKSTYRRSAI